MAHQLWSMIETRGRVVWSSSAWQSSWPGCTAPRLQGSLHQTTSTIRSLKAQMSGPQQDAGNGSNQSNNGLSVDSITLGQLKTFGTNGQKPKQSWFDFKYDDEDTVMNEIEEFYSYIEMSQVAENLKAWEGCFPFGEWTKATPNQRKSHVELLLEGLEHRDAEIRFTNARRLFYVLQGTFAETGSPEHQLHWIFENCKLVRNANGISSVVEALKIAGRKHDLLSNLSDQDAAHFHISLQDKTDLLEEVLTEISVYLGMLYHLIEVFKGHEDFADELMSMDPPLPVYLFNLVAGLRDKSAKGYPIKKLLLVLWKTLLACWGGMKDHERVKKIARELAGLPPIDGTDKIKSSPVDIETFRQETAVKYPTFTPPPQPPPAFVDAPISRLANPALLTRRLSQAHSPIPIRHHYHHDEPDIMQMNQGHGQGSYPGQMSQSNSYFRGNPQPATPAPSPPPSPKPKKQQYQTDQNRPFLFPFSKHRFGRDAKLVPFAVEEADRLFNKHMHVSLALAQMWRTREDCMSFESGLERMPGTENDARSSTYVADEDEAGEPLPDLKLLDEKIAEANAALANAQTPSERRKALERKEDLLRLKRVEQIYSSVLPVLSGWVLVLLKLLLATVSPNANNIQLPQTSTSSVFVYSVAAPEQIQQPPPTLDEIDVIRHREVTSKAVSAILLLVLKWFKVSHVMKFHHLGQHLLDTNCLLLILKMFGLQEVAQTVVSKADSPENNFFRYCQVNLSKNPQMARPEDEMIKPPRQIITRVVTLPNGETHEEEVEQVTEYSWRNFFATINFAKIMQKLSKGRSHRIWMLVQYKSSAVLKRVLRVPHPLLQLHILKLIKSQVPFCGRKWRQTNMKVITAIYLNCRPDLRDEWLTGTEPDDAGDAQTQEQALRYLVKFYNNKRYGPTSTPHQHGPVHRRTGSMSNHLEGLQADPQLSSLIRPLGTPNTVDSDVFPPSRAQAPNPSIFLPYMTEDIAFEEEYEEYLSDLGLSDEQYQTGGEGGQFHPSQSASSGNSAWHRLPEDFSHITDNISDSESIVSIGDLGDRLDPGKDDQETVDENLNNWEHMSPKTMAALPKSPAGRRRSSSGSGGLRPVIPFGLDDSNPVEDLDDDLEDLVQRDHTGPSVDEVEYAYGV
ncbi:N1221-domain-containing protein [Coprinopsis marcescibilis]|uniref:N1221-domain-containing protein n=1 Tax=Coprinopsis marcescibilis TaxID=230819 RepID=A0A5C3L353_COPMA|nr:N1221-domain-containing protein [Coprinopsis marcescibilis]